MLLGHTCVCAVEIDPYCRKILLQRQRDGILPKFPIWDDVRTFDGRPWRGKIDCICGGFPCQDISVAGKGAGLDGERSGLWREFARIIGEIRPKYALLENSPMLVIRGLGRVLGDLAEIGYNARWLVMGADDVGAPHTDASESGFWRTPDTGAGGEISADKAADFAAGKTRASGNVIQIRLCDQVRHPQLWPTPTVCGNNNRKGLTKTSGDGLATAVLKTYPTPKCQDAGAALFDRHKGNLGEVIHGRYLNGGNATPQMQTARLNPNWVEWLMGWPIGYTDSKPLATDKFRSWRQLLLTF